MSTTNPSTNPINESSLAVVADVASSFGTDEQNRPSSINPVDTINVNINTDGTTSDNLNPNNHSTAVSYECSSDTFLCALLEAIDSTTNNTTTTVDPLRDIQHRLVEKHLQNGTLRPKTIVVRSDGQEDDDDNNNTGDVGGDPFSSSNRYRMGSSSPTSSASRAIRRGRRRSARRTAANANGDHQGYATGSSNNNNNLYNDNETSSGSRSSSRSRTILSFSRQME